MDQDTFRHATRASAQRLRDIVQVILTEMGSAPTAIQEKGGTLYLYIKSVQAIVLGMIIIEQVHNP